MILHASKAHTPVLIDSIIDLCSPIKGHWLDGTFGAGGYARALLAAGARHVTGVDRDSVAISMAQSWLFEYEGRIRLVKGQFSALDSYVDAPVEGGVVLDLGVSSMQLDVAERGFSFQKDGPLDMRMGQVGPSAVDIVNGASEAELADILFYYGEERASRRIARAILRKRAEVPIMRTLDLAEIITRCLPRAKPGQSHPATRSFQALRIAVNAEFSELIQGLWAAERVLAPGGFLVVVTFHSLEDRIVKRFCKMASGGESAANRHAPLRETALPRFESVTRRVVVATPDEVTQNPRARSAKLRVLRRTNAASVVYDDVFSMTSGVLPDTFSVTRMNKFKEGF